MGLASLNLTAPPGPAAPSATGAALKLAGVVKAYGPHRVLADLDLDIQAGQFVALVGRSGCGKSTLLRLAAGLESPDAGTLAIAGRAPELPTAAVRVMFQEARLLPWKTVLDNVGLGLAGDWRAAALDALRQVGLAERAGDWPTVLSGGQRQRVALARALVSQPRLLLLDEPLGALDALTRIEMQRLIERLWLARGFTALLVTHDVAEAVALADRVVMLEQGRIGLDLPIALPRPRQRGDIRYATLEGRVLEQVLGQPGSKPDIHLIAD
ncbi:ATP-binding cassette domain-containing protein [Methylomagnum ishizawai]|uniref:ATP-binding cassette domain-containing protein n=1 Tax=Methylomagnum ishizawai TaxID=1760988 RepID=UPI001C33A353|nr:ATP-binding cassette domain-containing protein [Methylomagnum ishizawai]BBL76156.1 aliphatic sulfonates import ATP-binding protein SsuB 3 [Methylomagnum ishizawai]